MYPSKTVIRLEESEEDEAAAADEDESIELDDDSEDELAALHLHSSDSGGGLNGEQLLSLYMMPHSSGNHHIALDGVLIGGDISQLVCLDNR